MNGLNATVRHLAETVNKMADQRPAEQLLNVEVTVKVPFIEAAKAHKLLTAIVDAVAGNEYARIEVQTNKVASTAKDVTQRRIIDIDTFRGRTAEQARAAAENWRGDTPHVVTESDLIDDIDDDSSPDS